VQPNTLVRRALPLSTINSSETSDPWQIEHRQCIPCGASRSQAGRARPVLRMSLDAFASGSDMSGEIELDTFSFSNTARGRRLLWAPGSR